MTIDTEHNLYKVYIDWQEHYSIWMSIADVIDGYEDAESVTKIEYISMCYISPFIFESLK
jgi:uncharacterized protein YbdZ (MbtH family)